MKTKILRCGASEVYFRLITLQDGSCRWLRMERDRSAMLRADHAGTFRDTSRCYPVGQLVQAMQSHAAMGASEPKSIPDDYEADTLSHYSKNVYATGHQPQDPLRF